MPATCVTLAPHSPASGATTAAPWGTAADLEVRLDAPLPAELAIGRGTAVFVSGWCYAPAARIRALRLVVDGSAQPLSAHSMPRLDVFRARQDGYRSGFWGFARVGPRATGGTCELRLHAELDSGGAADASIAQIPIASLPEPAETTAPAPVGGPPVAICMATHNPPHDLFERQVASIREQTHANWACVVADDCSDPERYADVQATVGGDPRFVVSRSPRRLGFYRNFERALALAPTDARYIALADQDDTWHPDKLAALLAEIGDARLVYSDARIVRADGTLVADTYWSRRRNNHDDMSKLLVTNSVTGAASLFPRALLDDALPFPPAQFTHFHDHWIALCALAQGEIRYVDRPLYDYVQHGDAFLGHAKANRMPGLLSRIAALRRDPRERVRIWREHYFGDACRLIQFATILQLRRGDALSATKHRALEQFVRADRSPLPLARLGLAGASEVVGLRRETLGGEWMLLHAFGWRHLAAATARDHPGRGLRVEAVPPAALDPTPEARAPAEPQLRAAADKIAPLALVLRDDAPSRINVLIPTIDLRHFFGGYIAKLNLARRLAEQGQRVRVVTVDPTGPLPPSWARELEAYSGLRGLLDKVEFAFGRESLGLEVSPDDAFVATTWWTAHIANAARRTAGGRRFLYMIQEYEPFTFPMGSYAALAADSYRLPHAALFSTELLRDYFRRHGIGIYADGPRIGDDASAAFENAITPIEPPRANELRARSSRQLLVYARPEQHAARNMFEVALLGLGRALARGAFDDSWTLHGIGTVERERRIGLEGGASLRLLPRAPQGRYGALLREHDVGLALMYTPHPSLVPIEMASAGMLAVTNAFENKTAEALARISSNLVTAEPSIDGVADALCAAAAGACDADRRVAGSSVRWSDDWDASFDDELLARVAGFLDR